MKRRAALILALLTAAASLFSCGTTGSVCEDVIDKSDLQRLELWICENVEGYDFSSYTEIYGLAGGKEYVNPRYKVWVGCEGQVLPDEYVLYTLTAWPDYADFARHGYHVTRITVTDPVIMICGLTVKSTREKFDETLTERGFAVTHEADGVFKGYLCRAVSPDGTYEIRLHSGGERAMIVVEAPVSNRKGIVF